MVPPWQIAFTVYAVVAALFVREAVHPQNRLAARGFVPAPGHSNLFQVLNTTGVDTSPVVPVESITLMSDSSAADTILTDTTSSTTSSPPITSTASPTFTSFLSRARYAIVAYFLVCTLLAKLAKDKDDLKDYVQDLETGMARLIRSLEEAQTRNTGQSAVQKEQISRQQERNIRREKAMKDLVTVQNKEIARLNALVAYQDKQKDKKKDQVILQNEEIARLNALVAYQTEEIDKKKDQVTQQDKQIAKMDEHISTQDEEIARLKEELDAFFSTFADEKKTPATPEAPKPASPIRETAAQKAPITASIPALSTPAFKFELPTLPQMPRFGQGPASATEAVAKFEFPPVAPEAPKSASSSREIAPQEAPTIAPIPTLSTPAFKFELPPVQQMPKFGQGPASATKAVAKFELPTVPQMPKFGQGTESATEAVAKFDFPPAPVPATASKKKELGEGEGGKGTGKAV